MAKSTDPTILVVPGSRWEDVAGTDRQLATALSLRCNVVWADPPAPLRSHTRALRWFTHESSTLTLLHQVGPPGASRAGMRALASAMQRRGESAALKELGADFRATIAMSPRAALRRDAIQGVKVLVVTDDWVAGAPLMGLARRWVIDRLRRNLVRADLVLAVSELLADELKAMVAPRSLAVTVMPNGTWLSNVPEVEREPHAILVGQLNERLSLDCIEETLRTGTRVVVIGPMAGKEIGFVRRLEALLAHPLVRWLGPLPYQEIANHLASARVGLTPYAESAFNLSSFPLKTLEYLGAGLPVVTTDLPAARRLDTDLIEIASSPRDFAQRVRSLVEAKPDRAAERRRRSFAAGHTWEARADELLALIKGMT